MCIDFLHFEVYFISLLRVFNYISFMFSITGDVVVVLSRIVVIAYFLEDP